jgi:S1-C subfamily serine protease
MQRSWQRSGTTFVVASFFLLLSSCAASVAQAPGPEPSEIAEMPAVQSDSLPPSAPPPAPPTVEEAPPCTMFAKPGVLRRAALIRLINAGLPRWMQGVEGDRMLANHRFQGWLIKSLYPGDRCYQEIDLHSGDIVQKVNGKSIEKPEQAFDVAESLRTAPAIVVEFLRAGKSQRITLAISDE